MNVTVDFSDGTTTVTETCKPQDKEGFVFWVKSRLATFNGSKEIEAGYAVNDVVDVATPVVTPPVLTQAEKDEAAWFNDYYRWLRIKKDLIDTGVVDITNTKSTSSFDKRYKLI